MKQIISILILSFGCIDAAFSKPPCSPVVTINSDITANRTLSNDTLYRVQGCVSVRNNATLSIQAGTTITFSDNDFLIIRKDGYIIAQGTSGNTIKFISNDAAGSRIPRNGGLIIEGDGVINKSTITLPCSITHSSGANNTDSSGILSYIEIHYLSGASSVTDLDNGLSLFGVGSKTIIDHIQVSNAAGNGISVLGGAPNMKNVFVLDCSKAGLRMVYGYVGYLQNLIVIQKNTAMHNAAGTYGILVENNPAIPGATPLTNFVASNITVLGIKNCTTGTVSTDYRDGIRFDNNAAGNLHNSFITGSNLYGLYVNDVGSVQHTATNQLNVSNSSFTGNAVNNYGYNTSTITWSTDGCSNTMADWIQNSIAGCSDPNNQFGTFDAAYDVSFCSNYCSGTFVRNFVLDDINSELDPPDYTGLPVFFDVPGFRGAIQDIDITNGWSTVCPQTLEVCSTLSPKAGTPSSPGTLKILPNPARAQTQIEFEAHQKGLVQILVMDKVNGRIFFEKEWRVNEPGIQRITIPLNRLMPDIYTVRVIIGNTSLYGKLVVQ